jgi:hypothetical protein
MAGTAGLVVTLDRGLAIKPLAYLNGPSTITYNGVRNFGLGFRCCIHWVKVNFPANEFQM